MQTPTLTRVIRLDSIKLDDTYYTGEGYFRDRPIVTSCGIFEYHLADGSVRRELRLPEHVFDPQSLASYKSKPIIITHEAGTIDKNNVEREIIGTILSEGYKDGDDVRVEIVIHDTDAMKRCGLRELSLGYELDLDETPGTWNGEPYDAIQKNIRVNHLALVDKARAGDQARLNTDGLDNLTGGKIPMAEAKTTLDAGIAASIARVQARRAKRLDGAGDPNKKKTPEELVQMVKDRRDRRDAAGDPESTEAAMVTIAQQDEDLETLLGVIDVLNAQKDFAGDGTKNKDAAEDVCPKCGQNPCVCDKGDGETKGDGEGTKEGDGVCTKGDGEGKEEPTAAPAEPAKAPGHADGADPTTPTVNADSVDAIVAERLSICRVGDKLHMDGLDAMSVIEAKKAVIAKVNPSIRLDGKEVAYINAAYDLAVEVVNSQKSTDFQRQQMMSGKPTHTDGADEVDADAARQRMIERRQKKENGGTK